MMDEKLLQLARRVGDALESKNLMLATAESCTGGLVAQIITSVSGSANWFERGFVTYSNEAKQEMLVVPENTILDFGAVSRETALAMAQGAINNSHAEVSLAVTGIAGPTGGTKEKPVGTICFALAATDRQPQTTQQIFSGERNEIREQAAVFILEQLILYSGVIPTRIAGVQNTGM